MNKDQLFAAFKELFPVWAKLATSYKKIGSKTLVIKFKKLEGEGEESRVFLYAGPDNWQFGTKLWRKRPERITKQPKEKKAKEKKEEVKEDETVVS